MKKCPSRRSRRPCSCKFRREADETKPRGVEIGWGRLTHRGEVLEQSGRSWRGAGATRERQARGAPEPDYFIRLGNKEGRGLHAVEVRIVDVRDGHHHALLEDLGRSRGKVRRYKSIRRRLIASAFAQRSARRAVDHQHATAHTHPGRACQGGRRERRYQGAHLRIGIECRGALVGCGSCSSIGVTGTVQMRASGSVRSIMPARRILFVGCLEMAWRVCACGGFITAFRGNGPIPQIT